MSVQNPRQSDKRATHTRTMWRCSICHCDISDISEAHHRLPRTILRKIKRLSHELDILKANYDLVPVCRNCHKRWFHSVDLSGQIKQVWAESTDPERALVLSHRLTRNGWGLLAWVLLRRHHNTLSAPDLLTHFLATEAGLSRAMRLGCTRDIVKQLYKVSACGQRDVRYNRALGTSYVALDDLIQGRIQQATQQIELSWDELNIVGSGPPFYELGLRFKETEIKIASGANTCQIEPRLLELLHGYEQSKLDEQVTNSHILLGCFMISINDFDQAKTHFKQVRPSHRLWNYGCSRLGLAYAQISKLHYDGDLLNPVLPPELLDALTNAAIAESIYAISMCYGWRVPFLDRKECMNTTLSWHPPWDGTVQPSKIVTWLLQCIEKKSVHDSYIESPSEAIRIALDRATKEMEHLIALRDLSNSLDVLY